VAVQVTDCYYVRFERELWPFEAFRRAELSK
jgi:hypothetical protein